MSDLIDRQNAISALSILADKMTEHGQVVIEQAIAVLRDMHPAGLTSNVKEAWGLAVCECGHRVFEGDIYCAHCGAKLVWGRE